MEIICKVFFFLYIYCVVNLSEKKKKNEAQIEVVSQYKKEDKEKAEILDVKNIKNFCGTMVVKEEKEDLNNLIRRYKNIVFQHRLKFILKARQCHISRGEQNRLREYLKYKRKNKFRARNRKYNKK